MLTIDNILETTLDDIYIVRYSDAENHQWTESAVLKFQSILYIINVDPDFDELEILLYDKSQASTQDQFNVDNDNIIKISKNRDNALFSLLGSKLTWVWEMTNNQGYFDGIQFQFDNKTNNIIQFIAIASRLQTNLLSSIETPSI